MSLQPPSGAQCLFCLAVWLLEASLTAAQNPQKVTYGKYYQTFKQKDGHKDTMDNSYYLYKPPSNLIKKGGKAKIPIVFQVIGNSWMKQDGIYHGPFTTMTPAIGNYNKNGIAYLSLAYRSTDMRYFYDDGGKEKAEELIHVDNDGRLTLDTTGKTMGDYKCRACWQELITKCIYDAVIALEHLIAHADEFGIDVHRIFFLSSSAGSSIVNYLTYVYHQWHQNRFTPVGMILGSPQFDLPVYCALDKTWESFMDLSKPDLKASELMDWTWCSHFIANAMCGDDPHGLATHKSGVTRSENCNMAWMNKTMKDICAVNKTFQGLTVKDLHESQKWDRSDPEVGLGMEKLWYVSENMKNYHPEPFYMLIHSHDNFFIHESMYVIGYAKLADQVGVNYTTYFAHYPGITAEDLGYPLFNTVDPFDKTQIYYRSSIEWRGLYETVHNAPAGSVQEHLLFVCFVLGLDHCGPGQKAATPLLRM
jgi:acetyl esterase/lipase